MLVLVGVGVVVGVVSWWLLVVVLVLDWGLWQGLLVVVVVVWFWLWGLFLVFKVWVWLLATGWLGWVVAAGC